MKRNEPRLLVHEVTVPQLQGWWRDDSDLIAPQNVVVQNMTTGECVYSHFAEMPDEDPHSHTNLKGRFYERRKKEEEAVNRNYNMYIMS